MRWMRCIFVRNAVFAVNAVKINILPLFTAFLTKLHRKIHRISYKNSPHLISKLYSIWFKFTRNFKDLSDSCRSELSSWRHVGGQRCEPLWGRFCFVRILRTRWKWIIHRGSPQKDARNTRLTLLIFTAFHRISYENSPPNLDPGIGLI